MCSSDLTKLEIENKKLHENYLEMKVKLNSNTELHLVEKANIERDFDASKREALVTIESLRNSQKQLGIQLVEAQMERNSLINKIIELETNLDASRTEFKVMKDALESMRAESHIETAKMSFEGEKFVEMKDELNTEVDRLRKLIEKLRSEERRVGTEC